MAPSTKLYTIRKLAGQSAAFLARVPDWTWSALVVVLVLALLLVWVPGRRGAAAGTLTAWIGSRALSAADALSAESAPEPSERVTVAEGDTLIGILTQAGVTQSEISALIAATSGVFRTQDLHAGQIVELTFAKGSTPDAESVAGLKIAMDPLRTLSVAKIASAELAGVDPQAPMFSAAIEEKKTAERPMLVSGSVDSTLYDSARASGLPLSVLMEFIRAFSFRIDFGHDIHQGDQYEILYVRNVDNRGAVLSDGPPVFASLTVGDHPFVAYRYTMKNGISDYFDASGKSVRNTLMKSPVVGGWISSPFGWRVQPFFGTRDFHLGIDIAVPMNSPVMAAGSGVVELAGYNDVYGNFIKLRHANGYETLYAHLNGFMRGIHSGAAVDQGQVIAYSGSTGESTGPHLHYEVIYRGEHLDPATVISPSGPQLSGDDLAAFMDQKSLIDAAVSAVAMGHDADVSGIAGAQS